MIVVVDASIVVDLVCDLLAAEPFRGVLSSATAVAAPGHLDAEVLSALGRLRRAGRLTRAAERVSGAVLVRGQALAPATAVAAGLGPGGPDHDTGRPVCRAGGLAGRHPGHHRPATAQGRRRDRRRRRARNRAAR